MFARLGRFTHRRRVLVLLVVGALAVLAAWYGPGVTDRVSGGGFDDPAAESARAAATLADHLGRSEADVVALYRHPDLAPDDDAFAAAVTDVLAGLDPGAVDRVVHPWAPGLPPEVRAGLLGTDGRSAVVTVTVTGADEDARAAAYDHLADDLRAPEPFETHLAGPLPVQDEMQDRAERDVVRAEVLAMPVLLVLMTVIFGSLVAAALPVAVGVVAILGAMSLLHLLTLVTDVSTFALNVTTILGLGLAIDYALFVVSRFREELAQVDDVAAAVTRTVATAGRTVAFSGVTVAVAFAGMLLFPQGFLRSMALGGLATVLLDMVLALTLLPALLAILGRRVDRGRLPRGLLGRLVRRRAAAAEPARTGPAHAGADGAWARLARRVMRRPAWVAVGTSALLAVVALPGLDLLPGTTDERDLPVTSPARQAVAEVDAALGRTWGTSLDVVLVGDVAPEDLAAHLDALSALDGVTDARVVAGDEDLVHVAVATDLPVDAPGARSLVHAVREVPAPDGAAEVLVGGPAARNVDTIEAITSTLPGALALVAGGTVVLLFLALGSVVLPLKAVVMNVLSLGATLGAITWAFGQGNLAGALGFTVAGRVDPSNLVLVAAVAFGLAMDYELFLLSRVREEHLRGADDVTAIATGLQRSGRTITSAARLLVVVLAAMAGSSLTFLKLIGLGLAFAVLLDATVVRALLVPATVRLLGRAAWWLPRPLARLHDRVGVAEDDGAAAPGRPAAPRELVGAGA